MICKPTLHEQGAEAPITPSDRVQREARYPQAASTAIGIPAQGQLNGRELRDHVCGMQNRTNP